MFHSERVVEEYRQAEAYGRARARKDAVADELSDVTRPSESFRPSNYFFSKIMTLPKAGPGEPCRKYARLKA